MLDNLCIEIENCNTEHFDKDNNVWCVDCYWSETDINKNKSYACVYGVNNKHYPYERFAVVATISKDGKAVTWNDNFKEAITEDNENEWVLWEISNKQWQICDIFKKKNS